MENANKITFFNKIGRIFGNLASYFKIRERKPYPEAGYSIFKSMLEGMENETCYPSLFRAAEICDATLDISKRRILLIEKISKKQDILSELECYNNLTDEEADKLKKLLESYVSLTKERNALRYQLADFDRSVEYMISLEEDANKIMPQLEDAEKKQRVFRNDISSLEGEKSALEYEQTVLKKGLVFIQRLTVAMTLAFCGVALFLAYSYMINQAAIFIPTSILVILLIFITVLIHVFRKRMIYELDINIKKQKRAVQILNRKNVVFAYYTNYLNYEYKKYKISNAHMLKNNLKDYAHFKHITFRIDAIRDILYETNRQIEKFLRDFGISDAKFTIEQFAQTINIEDKKFFYGKTQNECAALERELDELDQRHAQLWEELMKLNEQDATSDKLIDSMIQIYFSQVSRFLADVNKGEDVEETS